MSYGLKRIEKNSERIMTDNEYSKTRKAAVDALIYWAKTGMREFTMRDAVNDYLEASGANRPSIGGEEIILAHRKLQPTDWRLTASMLCPKRNYPRWTGSWWGL